MKVFDFDTKNMFNLIHCGKFVSPNSSWMHYQRELTDFEFMFVTEGKLYIGDDTTRYTISSGEYLLMSPTKNQYGYQASDCSFYWMHFNYNDNANNPYIYDYEKVDKIEIKENHLLISETNTLSNPERLIILLKQLLDSEKRYHDNILNTYSAITILAEGANQSRMKKKFIKEYTGDQLFNDICEYISMHVSENISVASLASHFNYSSNYLSVFFRKRAGYTIKNFMLQRKMEVAKAELSDTNHSISQVAYNVGFDDVHNFSNAFKKVTGFSPTSYRNSYSKRSLNC